LLFFSNNESNPPDFFLRCTFQNSSQKPSHYVGPAHRDAYDKWPNEIEISMKSLLDNGWRIVHYSSSSSFDVSESYTRSHHNFIFEKK